MSVLLLTGSALIRCLGAGGSRRIRRRKTKIYAYTCSVDRGPVYDVLFSQFTFTVIRGGLRFLSTLEA